MFNSYVALRDMWLVFNHMLRCAGIVEFALQYLIWLFSSKVVVEVKSVQLDGYPWLYVFRLLEFI